MPSRYVRLQPTLPGGSVKRAGASLGATARGGNDTGGCKEHLALLKTHQVLSHVQRIGAVYVVIYSVTGSYNGVRGDYTLPFGVHLY